MRKKDDCTLTVEIVGAGTLTLHGLKSRTASAVGHAMARGRLSVGGREVAVESFTALIPSNAAEEGG